MARKYHYPTDSDAARRRARNVAEAYPHLDDDQVARVADAIVTRNIDAGDLDEILAEIINEPEEVFNAVRKN